MTIDNTYTKQIIGEKELQVMLRRLACELIENHNNFPIQFSSVYNPAALT